MIGVLRSDQMESHRKEEECVKMELEPGVMLPKAKEYIPEAGEAKKDSSWSIWKEHDTASHMILEF